MIELYIENKKIDITDDLEINFTYESIDPDKLSAIKNSFSKTVNIPGTANNNITFGHIFRYDKYIQLGGDTNIDNNYDPHKKANWFINKNGAVINRGYCTLDNIIVRNEREVTYQLTLYGGIGEFFYSLTYNEDGSPKTLYDMFWDWYPKVGLIGHSSALNESEENVKTLYKCSADIVASTYHKLNPLYHSSGTTEIDKDVVFIPCYTGLYEDFDSKHMLVSTFNQNYNSVSSYMSEQTKLKLQSSFPDSYTEDDKTYTTLDKNFSSTSGYRYGLVTFSRDVDPWEAGDLRINELPIGIRLSKMMEVISQPNNNGGYQVIWDDEIKNSYHWLYSWIMLGKIKQDKNELNLLTFSPSTTYDGQYTTINVDYQTGEGDCVRTATSYDLPQNVNTVQKGNYNFYLNVFPNLTFRCADFQYWNARYNDYISGSMHDNGSSFRYIWTTPVLVHKIYSGSTLIKSIADIFYFSTNPSQYYFGYGTSNVSISDVQSALNNKINQRFMNEGEFIDEYRYHNCKLENPEVSGEGYIKKVAFNCANEQIITNLNFNSDISDFRVEQSQGIMWTNLSSTSPFLSSGLYGVDDIDFNVRTTGSSNSPSGLPVSAEAPYGFVTSNAYSMWPYNMFSLQANQNNSWAYFNMNEVMNNGILTAKDSGFNIINLDKKTLFANSQSPMKYLSGFCKLMNYKFICDDTNKKIYIHTLKNYYLDRTIDINDRVDIGRDINIKNITTKSKTINIGLDTPESYPTYIFNKISRDKFNTKRYDTGIKYNAAETNLLNDLTYKNLLEWQQSSVYYNLNPQFPRPYNVQSISWTLFNVNSQDSEEIEKKEIFTVGTPSNTTSLLAKSDFLPKIGLFDKDNKTVDFESSLVFLNGFVRNYDYSLVGEVTNTLTPDSINESHYINSSGTVGSSSYQDIYIYNNIDMTKTYKVTASFSTSYSSYTVNYYNSSGTRIGTEYSQYGATLVNSILTIPSGTTSIRCNFRKSDTDAKLTITGNNYSISPRVCFSNDMYEQYFLNQARCYMYDFKYNDNFVSWGAYSTDQKGTATSWVLPMFVKDLYNVYDETNGWINSTYKRSSWNFINQEGLDTWYNLNSDGTKFIVNPNYNFPKATMDLGNINYNEYSIPSIPIDDNDTERIYDLDWKDYLDDLYDRNARDIVAYVDLSGFGDAKSIMRYFYAYKSHLWIITKLENFKIAETVHDKFTKVTLHKIKDKDTWV